MTDEMKANELTSSDIDNVRRQFAAEVGDMSDQWVGQQVRDIRKAKRLSLKQLSEAAGISIGLLSQIERGSSSPSLRSLQAISKAVGVSPVWFFNDGKVPPAEERDVIVRRGAGRKLDLPHKRLMKELLTPDLSGSLQMLLVTIEAGGTSGGDSYWHPGEECGYVLQGEMELWVDGQHFHLHKGDSFRFKSELPHKSYNPGKSVARILWITSPPFY